MNVIPWVEAISAFLAVMVLWHLAMVAALRSFGIRLPISFAFHGYNRRERELHAALKELSGGRYVFVSGYLLLACPLFAGFTAYSYIADRYIWHVAPKSFAESAGSVTGSILIFLVFGAVAGISDWKKLQKEVGVQR